MNRTKKVQLESNRRYKSRNKDKLCAYNQEYRIKNREKLRQRSHEFYQKYRTDKKWVAKNRKLGREKVKQNRILVINHYGSRCACCGEKNLIFLAIDHINNDGAKEKKIHNWSGGGALYAWIIKNEFPKTYQVLCHNCNWAKRFGTCPHKCY